MVNYALFLLKITLMNHAFLKHKILITSNLNFILGVKFTKNNPDIFITNKSNIL